MQHGQQRGLSHESEAPAGNLSQSDSQRGYRFADLYSPCGISLRRTADAEQYTSAPPSQSAVNRWFAVLGMGSDRIRHQRGSRHVTPAALGRTGTGRGAIGQRQVASVSRSLTTTWSQANRAFLGKTAVRENGRPARRAAYGRSKGTSPPRSLYLSTMSSRSKESTRRCLTFVRARVVAR